MRRNSFSSIEAFLETELRGRDGSVKFRQEQPIKSFLLNWTKALYGLSYDKANSKVIHLTDVGGTDVIFPALYSNSYPIFCFRSGEGDTRYGIVVGSGTTGVSLEDYKLASEISHGTGTGQLYYYKTDTSYSTDADRSYLSVHRTFENKSTSNVTVSEVGLKFVIVGSGARYYYFLILRDLLDTAVTMAPLDVYTVRYKFTFLL